MRKSWAAVSKSGPCIPQPATHHRADPTTPANGPAKCGPMTKSRIPGSRSCQQRQDALPPLSPHLSTSPSHHPTLALFLPLHQKAPTHPLQRSNPRPPSKIVRAPKAHPHSHPPLLLPTSPRPNRPHPSPVTAIIQANIHPPPSRQKKTRPSSQNKAAGPLARM